LLRRWNVDGADTVGERPSEPLANTILTYAKRMLIGCEEEIAPGWY